MSRSAAFPPIPSPSNRAHLLTETAFAPRMKSEVCIISLRKQTIRLEKAPNVGIEM